MRMPLFATLLMAVSITPVQAQQQAHKGFWIGFGFGGGVNLSRGLDGTRLGGGAGYLRLGGTPSQQWLLGGEAIAWTRDRGGNTLDRGNATFTALFYPSEAGGGYFKAGVGFASVAERHTSGSSTTTTTKEGFGATLGTGIDLRLGHNIYLVPALDWLFQVFEKTTDPVLGAIPGTNNILVFTLGLTWH